MRTLILCLGLFLFTLCAPVKASEYQLARKAYVVAWTSSNEVAIGGDGLIAKRQINSDKFKTIWTKGERVTQIVALSRGDLAYGTASGQVMIWNEKRAVRKLLTKFNEPIVALATNRDGSQLAVACTHHLEGWQLKPSWKKRYDLPLVNDSISAMSLAGDGSQIILAGSGIVRFYSTAPFIQQGYFTFKSPFTALAGSADGSKLMFNSDEEPIAFFRDGDTDDLWRIPCLTRVTSIEFSPDGTHFLTGCRDGLTILWSTKTHLPVGVFGWRKGKPIDEIVKTSFSPDGTWVMSLNKLGAFCIWPIEMADPVAMPPNQANNESSK